MASEISNSFIMVCPPVREITHALVARGLSPMNVDNVLV